MAAQHERNSTATTAFSTVGGSQNPSLGSKPRQPVNDLTTLYSESMSSPRRALSRKNSDQPRGNSSRTGRFTTNQVATATPAVRDSAPRRPVRMPRTSIGPKNSSGYSLAAAPNPISTPAGSGLRRAQASRPAIAKPVASASKLVKIWKITRGEAATRAASHTRRPARPAVAQTVASQASASPNAATSKNITTSATTGTGASLLNAV
jgi:hypothetical protein